MEEWMANMKKSLFNKKNSLKLISFFLCLIILYSVIPSVIYAEVADAISARNPAARFPIAKRSFIIG